MIEISLVGASGEEVILEFEYDDHVNPSGVFVYAGSELPGLMEKGGLNLVWRSSNKEGMIEPNGPDAALFWLRRHGFKAVGEEECWLETGSWE